MAVDYSRLASDYDAIRGNETVDREFWLAALRDVGHLAPGERILDLGAGTGRFSRLLAQRARVVAFDLSPEMLRQSLEKGDFARVRGDAHRLPFRSDSFDATVVVMVLHQLADYRAALCEVARVSRRIAIATSDIRGRELGILAEAFPSLLEIDRKRFPPISGIVTALEAAGFRGIAVETRPLRRSLPVSEELERVRRKYISTLDLLPLEEFSRGLALLERELPRRYGDVYDYTWTFTFAGASR